MTQLEHSHENEATLRGQLRDAKSQLEAQNSQLSQLELKLSSYDVSIETKTARLTELNAELQTLKVRLTLKFLSLHMVFTTNSAGPAHLYVPSHHCWP